MGQHYKALKAETNEPSLTADSVGSRDDHGNGIPSGNGTSMGIPWELGMAPT